MNCPVCDAKLRAVDKHGVEVDICPDCKGVWLDRGELEKLIEMAANDGPVQRIASERPSERPHVFGDDQRRYEDDHHEKDPGHSQGSSHQKRKGSWLTDVLGSFGGGED